nr:ATP-binding protein [Thiomonas sp. FB-6]
MSGATQRILRIRRDYNAWVADESMEDYALRFTARRFRKWSELSVANTAFGAVSFLAMEAIGGTIALNYGFANAVTAILVVGLIIFLTGLPISYYAARFGVDMDLLTRGAGFGYLGSTLTSLIYASFTFIFFALEAAILALALQLYFGLPMLWAYLLSSLVVIPLVVRGITLISRLQLFTQPVWALLLLCPYLAVAWRDPHAFSAFTSMAGRISGGSGFDLKMFGAASAVAFSLIVQIGEQVDYLRFLPEPGPSNRKRWWAAVVLAGPGWILPGMLKMLGGAFLTYLAMRNGVAWNHAVEPTQMYLAGYAHVFSSPAWGLAAVALLVLVSQIKINVTNAYAGSLAWSNFFARLTHSHPGRVVWLVFNVLIATLLMTMGVFHAIEGVLSLYGNLAIAWVGALVADLVINKPLGLSPPGIEFKRAYLYDVNPVGLGAMLLAAALAVGAHAGSFGPDARAFAPFIALAVSLAAAPLIAWATRGRFYLAREPVPVAPAGTLVRCTVCENEFEADDMASCPAYGGTPICSLCCTLESRCHDACKSGSRVDEQAQALLHALLPPAATRWLGLRALAFLALFACLAVMLSAILGVAYLQHAGELRVAEDRAAMAQAFGLAFAVLLLVAAVFSWWIVLAGESRRMARDESNRHNQLLMREVEAHKRTDAALQAAKEAADSANQAKTRYVAGMTHELRTPLNSILGYSQILLKSRAQDSDAHEAVRTIHRSAEHMLALVDGLLDLARIEAGRLRLEQAPLELPAFLDELERMVRPQAQAKGLEFVVGHVGRMPQWVQADAKCLRQILINLLSNAVRFTRRGRVSLQVDCRHEVLRFDVEDTGIGVAPQDLQRIFLPFERGAGGRQHSSHGTGLGLTITGLLASLMGGELSLARTSAQGSVFSVRLYLPEVPGGARPGAAPPLAHPVGGYLGRRRTLLVVDDQPVQRQLLVGMLAPLGFGIVEAASGTECLQLLQATPTDAVLLDISMDDLDGWETVRRLRRAGHGLPVVMVSANMFENQPDRLSEAGCQAFVGKPVIESELLSVLQRLLELEWVDASPSLLHGAEAAAEAPALRLPGEAHARALQLLRLGHVAGLRELLDRVGAEHPDLAPRMQELRGLLQRYDLHGLRRSLHDECDA